MELLAEALSGSSAWDRTTALRFLQLFPDDVPELLDPLLDLSLSSGWAQLASEVIRAGRKEIDPSLLSDKVVANLPGSDAEDHLRIAAMLAHVEAWETLGLLIRMALQSADPEIRDVAQEFNESCGGMLR
ncbi:hypothetical protein ACIO7M_11735 [Streptomyces toxytricini]|uniref:HEAT repeat domain-containing protein n=1 Tax=Streptomyces toxytricini TaxID=67369 RepID=A0ABW8EEV3_STRT5